MMMRTAPLVRWYYEDSKIWVSYTTDESDTLERIFNLTKGRCAYYLERNRCVDFVLGEERNNRTIRKVRRGTWFFEGEDSKWWPYPETTSRELEAQFQARKFGKIKVTEEPLRYVELCSDGTFRQYRHTKNAEIQGRPVIRGFNGLVIPTDTVDPITQPVPLSETSTLAQSTTTSPRNSLNIHLDNPDGSSGDISPPSATATVRTSARNAVTRMPGGPPSPRVPVSPQSSRVPAGRQSCVSESPRVSACPPSLCVSAPQSPSVSAGPQSSRVSAGPQSSRVSAGPQSPRVSAGPQSPRVSAGPQSPRVSVGPQSPLVSAGPQSPRVSAAPQSPRVSAGPQSPRVSAGPQSPRVSASPQSSRIPASPQSSRIPASPQSPRNSVTKPPENRSHQALSIPTEVSLPAYAPASVAPGVTHQPLRNNTGTKAVAERAPSASTIANPSAKNTLSREKTVVAKQRLVELATRYTVQPTPKTPDKLQQEADLLLIIQKLQEENVQQRDTISNLKQRNIELETKIPENEHDIDFLNRQNDTLASIVINHEDKLEEKELVIKRLMDKIRRITGGNDHSLTEVVAGPAGMIREDDDEGEQPIRALTNLVRAFDMSHGEVRSNLSEELSQILMGISLDDLEDFDFDL